MNHDLAPNAGERICDARGAELPQRDRGDGGGGPYRTPERIDGRGIFCSSKPVVSSCSSRGFSHLWHAGAGVRTFKRGFVAADKAIIQRESDPSCQLLEIGHVAMPQFAGATPRPLRGVKGLAAPGLVSFPYPGGRRDRGAKRVWEPEH